MTKGQIIVNAMMVIAVAVTVFGSLAAATVWSPGTYGLERGSVSWPSQQVSADLEVVQLGGTSGQASQQERTVAAVELGSNGSPSSSQQQASATVQLGSSGGQASSQASASEILQLSGYADNRGEYTNIYIPPFVGVGTFGGGGSGCGCG